MKRYLYLILLFSLFMSSCTKHNSIDFSTSKAFFSSLNERNMVKKENKIEKKEIIKNENKNNVSGKSNLKKHKIEKTNKQIHEETFLLTLSSYRKQLKEKIGTNELIILKIFIKPSLKIKHGKIKNFQFHLNFCHLDLFFLQKGEAYIFKHFDIRPPNMSSNLKQKECVKELNNKFTLIHDLK